MNYRRCSRHDVWLVLHDLGGLRLWVCPVPGCHSGRAAKHARRLKKSTPACRFLGVGDKLKMRDRARSRRPSARVR
jgi:hypothetical protein